MARQLRLMESLEPAPHVEPKSIRTLDRKTRVARPEEEQRALEAAIDAIAQERTDEAWDLLLPFVESANDPRTLTTLSRIASSRGDMEFALELLQRAEAIDQTDPKVLHFTAELLRQLGRHVDELHYRRRAAFTQAQAPAIAFAHLIPSIVKAAPRNRKPPLTEIRLALDRVKAADDLPVSRLTEVAESIFGIPSMREEAMSLYRKANTLASGEREVLAARRSLNEWCADRSMSIHRLDSLGTPGRRPMFAELRQVAVAPSFQWLPFPEDGSVILSKIASRRLQLRSEDPQSPIVLSGTDAALLRLPTQARRIMESAILLGGTGDYYNDLVEYASALAVPETLNLGNELKLLVNADLASHQLELFEMLGIGEDRLIRCDRAQPLMVDSLWMPSRLTAGDVWCDPLVASWYRVKMQPFVAATGPSRKLYLSRGDAATRRVLNEPAVMSALEPLGFECVAPESLSLRERVALFSKATHIVAPSGAALTNMLFAPPGANVIILASRRRVERRGGCAFEALAKACSHRSLTVDCGSIQATGGVRSTDTDIVVDCQKLIAALNSNEDRLAG